MKKVLICIGFKMRWIKKLIKLLNEKEWDTFVSIKWDEDHFKDDYFKNHERKIISKRYGFIKWLVENNKINIDKLKFQSDFMFPLWKNFDQMGSEDIEEYSDYESLLMLLSIQEEPVSFLITLLK